MNITQTGSTRLPLTPAGVSSSGKAAPSASTPSSLDFGSMLDQLTQVQAESDTLMEKLAAGEDVDLHTVMIAAEQTDVSFRIAIAMRDKLVSAYQEVMRMNV